MGAPRTLLSDVHWSFSEPVPRSPAALLEAARAYAADLEVADPAGELLNVLPFADVLIRYEVHVRDRSGAWTGVDRELRIVGADLARLTGADLLWELHVGCAGEVGEQDAHYFEGLELERAGKGMAPAVYRVNLGS